MVGAVTLLLAAACGQASGPGSADAPTSGPATAVDSPASPTAPATSSTSAPQQPPPAEFRTRADEVAAAVRAAGLPRVTSEFVLRYDRTPDLGFDTDAQKIAWAAGRVTIGPGVPSEADGSSPMSFADGPTRTVDVIGSQQALDLALPTEPTTCAEIPDAECRLLITGAELETIPVETYDGTARVPAWSFTVEGLSHRIHAIAVPPSVLGPAPQLFHPEGLEQAPPALSGGEEVTGVDGSTLRITIGHGACDTNVRAHVVEYPDLVVVGGTHDLPPTGTMCVAMLVTTPATLTLGAPLADRAVVSAHSGTVIRPAGLS